MKKMLFILLAVVVLISLAMVACKEEAAPTTKAPAATTTAPAAATTKAPSPTTTAAPAPTTTSPDAAKYGGVYKQALTVAPARPIGYLSEGAPDSGTAAAPAIEGLVSVNRAGKILPKLAVSWEVAKDGKSMIIGLRKGVKFHDGSDFNAAVAKWNMDLQIAAKKTQDWTSIDVVDDYTLRINVNAYKNTMLTNLAGGISQMASKAFFDKNGIDVARWSPVGTGPFIFVSYERDAKLTYKRNPDYWEKGKPYLDGLEFVVIADATVRKLAFQKGEIHRLAVAGLDAVELQKAGYEMITEGGGTFALVPDSKTSSSPWANINVRLAASYALDRESLNNALGYGFARPAYQLYPGFEQTAIPNLDVHKYNPEKAKSLLRDAGYPNGFKTVMHVFTRVIPPNFSTAVAAQLRAVGINIEVDNPTAGKYEEYRYGLWDGVMHHAINSYSNFAGMSTYWTGIQFPTVKLPAGFVEGCDAMAATKEPDPKLIQDVIRIMHDDVTIIPYMEESRVTFLGKGVHDPGVYTHSLMAFIDKEAWLDASIRK